MNQVLQSVPVKPWLSRKRVILAVVIAFFAYWAWAEWSISAWRYEVSTTDDGTKVTDGYRFMQGHAFQRVIESPTGVRLSGPLSESGKPHGHWIALGGDAAGIESIWFWFGDRVTEGEWHQRSK
jgi:hypothetical protein